MTLTPPVRQQSVTVRIDGEVVPADTVSWEHGVNLTSGDVVGSDATVDWATPPGVVVGSALDHPMRPGWDCAQGAPVTIDVDDNGTTRRVFTGRLDDASGALRAGVSSRLGDHIDRLQTRLHLPPLAAQMPRNPHVADRVRRHVGLWGVWYTHLAMLTAGFAPTQPLRDDAVLYVSFCGSAATIPNPDRVTEALGDSYIVRRNDGNLDPPVPVQGDNVPCMENVAWWGYTLPRRNAPTQAWQMTIDMASATPTVFHTGRVDLRATDDANAGVRLDWTQTLMRVYRVEVGGTGTTFLGSVARAFEGVYDMRWSVRTRADGSLTLSCPSRPNALHIDTDTGIQIGTSASAIGWVRVQSEGPVSSVQVSRSSALDHVDRPVDAQILRATFGGRQMPAFDYVDPTPAMSILTDQADAERSLRGMPLWMWVDVDGRLVNADPHYLWAQPVQHRFTTVREHIALDDVEWSLPRQGPYQRVDVRARVGSPKIRLEPTFLLAEGRDETAEDGDPLEQVFHPPQDETWLLADVWPYMAGYPYPSPPYRPAAQHELNRAVGSWVGGSRTDATTGDRTGWLEPGDAGWTVDTDTGFVHGALTMLDHRSMLYSGTVSLPAGVAMSTVAAAPSLFEHRRTQPFPQVRGWGIITWSDEVTSTALTGLSSDPVLEHDAGMWVQGSGWRSRVASDLAEAATNRRPDVVLTTAVDPSVRVGERAVAAVTYPDGAKLVIHGLVARVRASLPSPSDQMEVRLVVMSSTWQAGPALPVEVVVPDEPVPELPTVPPRDRTPPIFIPTPPVD